MKQPHFRICRCLIWITAWSLAAGAGLSQAQAPADPCTSGPALFREARFSEARTALEQCLQENGPSSAVIMPLLVMSVQEARLSDAVRYGADAVELDPTDPEAHYWYGRALLRAKRQPDAKAQWEKGLQESQDHLGLLEGLGRLALAEGQSAKAYQLFSRMQHLGVRESWLSRVMADISAGKGLWTQSLGHLEEAMALEDTTAVQDLLTASELSIMAGDKSKGVEFSRRAVALEPGAATYGGLGQAYFALEEVDSALVYLRLALEQDPDDSRVRFNLANALEISGRVEEADLQFRTYLQQKPDDSVGHFNYAIHLDKMGYATAALQAVDRAIDLDANMLTARVVRVQLLEELARWDDALDELAVLRAHDAGRNEELDAWQARLIAGRDRAAGNFNAGKVHLQHLVVGTAEEADKVQQGLASGRDFTDLVVRYSSGPAAARGGDIGWLEPAQMVPAMREAIDALAPDEISPPIESKGLYHFFKRLP